MKTTTISIIMALLMLMPIGMATIGLTRPLPNEIELRAGEEGRFKWAVQAIGENQDLTCNIVTSSVNENLEITYDEGTELNVKAGAIKYVSASVIPDSSLA